MSATIQLLTTGMGSGIHLRWAFDPPLGFPDGGFDVYRRRSAAAAAWILLPYSILPSSTTAYQPLTAQNYAVTATGASSTGAAAVLAAVNGVRALLWNDGQLGFAVTPPAARLAVWVGHHEFKPAGDAPPEGPGGKRPILLRALSPSGVEVTQVDPPAGVPVRVEFAAQGVTEVRIEGAGVFVTGWEILSTTGGASWGPPLNGNVPIRLPRSDNGANLASDITARVGNAGMATLFATPTDPTAVDELRQLIEGCQPDPAATPGPQWIASTDPDGSVTSVDPLALLLMLALRPLVAQVLGLYWIDDTAQAGVAYDYRVEGHWGAGSPVWARIGTAAAEEFATSTTTSRIPAAIPSLTADAAAAAIAHPLSAPGRPIFAPVKCTKLSWSVTLRTNGALVDYDAVLYEIDRQALGLLVPPESPPPSPSLAAWTTLNADAPQFVGHDESGAIEQPMYRDVPADPAAPLEGWYAYRVRGLSVFGLQSAPSPAALVLLLDDFSPACPAGLAGPSNAVGIGDAVTISWSWGPDQALSSPDAATFRIYLQDLAPATLMVTTTAPVIDVLTGDATVPLNGGPLPADAASTLPGAQLEVDGRGYLIRSAIAGGTQHVVVALSNGQAPQAGRPATITTLPVPAADPMNRVATVNVQPPVAGSIAGAVFASERVSATISPAAALAAASLGATVYDRTSGLAFVVETPPDFTGATTLVPPPDFGSTSTLPTGNVLVFARPTATIAAPFAAGAKLRYGYFGVTAADARSYRPDNVTSGTLAGMPGNESAPSLQLPVMFVDPTPPPPPGGGTDPDGPNIYATPPDFYSRSYYTVPWTATSGVRYQVLRALDKTIFAADASRGSARLYQDAEYATLTNRQFADLAAEFSDIYTIRTTVPIAGNSYVDELPGSGPNRFVYRIASVSEAGVRGALSEPWAPVWIPDTIPPSRPVPKNATIDDDVVFLRWTQPNENIVDYFHVYRTTDESSALDVQLMGTPLEPTPAVLARVDGAFVLEDRDVVDGVRYWYRITAVREVTEPVVVALESPASPPIAVKAFSASPPPPPVITTSSWNSASRQLALEWTQPMNSTAYVQRSFDRTSWRAIHAAAPGSTVYTDDLSQDADRTVAYYRVRVTTANGRSSTSDDVEVLLP